VLVQRAHAGYLYARCASIAGARVEWVDDLEAALAATRPAAVLHPAHLDDVGMPLVEVERVAGEVPVIVDAAFQVSGFGAWTSELAVFSAKYFGGPNAGGFVAGSAERVADVAALDFVGFESGPWRTFGRAWKLDRGTVAATVAALEAWAACDHDARAAELGARAVGLAEAVGGSPCRFTFDERVLAEAPFNAVRVPGAAGVVDALAGGDPSVRAMGAGEDLLLCLDCVSPDEVDELGAAVSALRAD
jgi:L-seryl-tRNA(Ser) seleniumtransferase